MPRTITKKTPSDLCASIKVDLNILKNKSSPSKKFQDNAEKILNSFDKNKYKIKTFLKENKQEISSKEKNELLKLFENATSDKKIEHKLINDVIVWVLRNISEHNNSRDGSQNEWEVDDNVVIMARSLFAKIADKKGNIPDCRKKFKDIASSFETNNLKNTEQDAYELVLTRLCLFILDKKDIFIKLAQKKADQEKIALSDTSNSKNTSNLSSPNSQKKGNKNLPPEAGKSLPPVSSQETMKKEANDQLVNQKDHSLTTELPSSDQSSLPSIQPTDLETSIEDNPINLDQHKKEKTKVVEFTLYFPDQKNKTADSCLNGQKNLDLQDITRYQFDIEPSLPYQDLKKISTELKNKRNRLKEKLLTLAQFPSNKALLNLKKSPLHLPVSAGLAMHTSIEDNQTQLDQNKEEKTKVVEVIIDFSQKEKIDVPDLVQLRKSTYEKTAESLSYSAIKKSTSYKDLEKEIEELKKEIRDLTSELQKSSHQNAQKETNIPIYEEALKNGILENQLKKGKSSENIYSEISSNALIKDDIEETSQQTNKNLLQEDQTKEINLPKDKSIQSENKLSQLENSILTLERKMVAEKDNAAYSTQSSKIEGEINQEDKADTEKFDTPSFEEDKLITENQTISHQSTEKEIVIKSSKVSVDQPETKRIDLQNIEEEGSQNLQKDNSIFPIEQATNNNPEKINVNIELQGTKKPSSPSFINEENVISSIRELDEEVRRTIQEEKELETNRDELTEHLKNLIYTSDIKNEEVNTSLIEEITKQINDIDKYQEKLKNKIAELLANILTLKKYYSLTVNSIIDEDDDIDLNNSCDLSRNMGTNSHAELDRNNEEAEALEWDKGDVQFDSEEEEDLEWDMYMDTNSHSEPDGNVENQEQRTSKRSSSLTEDQENNSQQRDNPINETIEKHNLSSEIEPTPLAENTSKEVTDLTHQLTENKTGSPITLDSSDSQEPLLSESNQQFEHQEKISSQPALTLDGEGEQENDSQQRDSLINEMIEKHNLSSEIEPTPLVENIAKEADDLAHQLTENKTDSPITLDSSDSQEPLLSESNQQFERQEKISSQPALTLDEDEDEDGEENDSQQRDNPINETIEKHNLSSEIEPTPLAENIAKEVTDLTHQLTKNKPASPITTDNPDSRRLLSDLGGNVQNQEQRTSEISLPLTEEQVKKSQGVSNQQITEREHPLQKPEINTQQYRNSNEHKSAQTESLTKEGIKGRMGDTQSRFATDYISISDNKELQNSSEEINTMGQGSSKSKNIHSQSFDTESFESTRPSDYEDSVDSLSDDAESFKSFPLFDDEDSVGPLSLELDNTNTDKDSHVRNRHRPSNSGSESGIDLPEPEGPHHSSESDFSGTVNDSKSGIELAGSPSESTYPLSDSNSESDSGIDSTNPSTPVASQSNLSRQKSFSLPNLSKLESNLSRQKSSSLSNLSKLKSNPSTPLSTEKEDFVELKKGRKINVPLFDFHCWDSFASFANIISSQIDKNNCLDITELNEFRPSDNVKKILRSNPDLKLTIDNEQKRLETELKNALSQFWKDYAGFKTKVQLALLISKLKQKIKAIQPKEFKELWKEASIKNRSMSEEPPQDFSEEYSDYIQSALQSAKHKTEKAGDYQTNPLLNQLKVKILRAGFETANQAEQAFEQGVYIEKGKKKEEKKKKKINLKQGEIDPSKQIEDCLFLTQSKVEGLMLDSIEKRLPLNFEAVVSCSEKDKSNIRSMTSTAMTHNAADLLLWVILISFISLFIAKFIAKENEKTLTNACTSLIKKNHLMIDPSEIKYGLKQKQEGNEDNKDNDGYKVIKPLSPLKAEYQLKIDDANNTKQDELIKDELIENRKPNHCVAMTPLSGA